MFCRLAAMNAFDFLDNLNKHYVSKLLDKFEYQSKLEGVIISVGEDSTMVTISNCDYFIYEELVVFLGKNGFPCQYQSQD